LSCGLVVEGKVRRLDIREQYSYNNTFFYPEMVLRR